MFRKFIEVLLVKMGERTEFTQPTVYEKVILHSFYLAPLLWVGLLMITISTSHGLPNEHSRAIGVGTILEVTGGLAALTVLFLIWAAQYRKKPMEMWAASHLVWISRSYLSLALFSGFAVLVFLVLLLFAAISTTIAGALIYGIPVLAFLTLGMFVIRLIKGYINLIRGKEMILVKKWRSRQESNLQPPA
ncbi:MAG: hypothetical protein KDJ26_08155 [Alphaproteobacteria bacterium]|nr:hypothetical protein [Alphaproteobacteria bacterium]